MLLNTMHHLKFVLMFIFYGIEESVFLNNFEEHFVSKTPYRIVANTNESKIEFEGCKPIKIWFITRHGTRTPTRLNVKRMKEVLPSIANRIIASNKGNSKVDIDGLKNWKLLFDYNTILTSEGAREMLLLSKRMQNRFPNLFSSPYSKTKYTFRYTNSQRTMASAHNFTLGLFGYKDALNVHYPEPMKHDSILWFEKLCSRWNEKMLNDSSSSEEFRFHNGKVMKEAIALTNKQLNLNGTLTLEDLRLMYQTCTFEFATYRKSVWCTLLPFDAIKVMEFSETLRSYYESGYLFEVTYKQACPLFNSMVDFLDSVSENPAATMYYSHEGTLLKFLAHLGLFKDEELLHTDFDKNYKWKLSKIGTFASNIAFVLHQCSRKKKVAVFFNERLIQLPNCGDLCDLEYIKNYYSDSINNCDFDQICNNKK